MSIILLSLVILPGCGAEEAEEPIEVLDPDRYVIAEEDFVNGEELIKFIEESRIDREERQNLENTRQFEKLARDILSNFYHKYDLEIFGDIADSEQTHMDAMKVLLDRYEIEDPIDEDTPGIFSEETLNDLYQDLLDESGPELWEPLAIGAFLEEMSIHYLEESMDENDNEDIEVIYTAMRNASINHFRALVIETEEESDDVYTPQYLSEEEFDEIMNREDEAEEQLGAEVAE